MSQFVPSKFSYGADESAGASGAGAASTQQYIDMLLPAAKEFFSEDDPRVLEAQIENLQRQMAKAPPSPLGLALPGTKSYYQNQINKLKAKLESAREAQASGEQVEQVYLAGRVGVMLGIFAGVVVLGAVAVNQLQRARLTQAEIERVKGGPG